MIKKLKEVKFQFDNLDCEVRPKLRIHQYNIVSHPAMAGRVYLTKREARSLYTFLKKVFE